MSKFENILTTILRGASDHNIAFTDLRRMLNELGFIERVKGSHHIFTRSDFPEIINLQPLGSKAKGYQVKQVRNLIVKYNLAKE